MDGREWRAFCCCSLISKECRQVKFLGRKNNRIEELQLFAFDSSRKSNLPKKQEQDEAAVAADTKRRLGLFRFSDSLTIGEIIIFLEGFLST